MRYDLLVIGAGAAGCFAAIRLKEQHQEASVCILEAGRAPLAKVRVSGGGRCNVTHACFDPAELVRFYPRGARELRGPFSRFQPRDMVQWLERQGVRTKTEADGRMFPVTDNSETIIDCFLGLLERYRVHLHTSARVESVGKQDMGPWEIRLVSGKALQARHVMVATGSDARMWKMLEELGHTLVPPVPSLFTFNIRNKDLHELSGLSVSKAHLRIPLVKLEASGPLLVTHWGLSGPAVLRLSAWGARHMQELDYRFPLVVNWTGLPENEVVGILEGLVAGNPRKQLVNLPAFSIPARLWRYLVSRAGLSEEIPAGELGKKKIALLSRTLVSDEYPVHGKSTFKEEFVTAGGVQLKEIDFRRFESKLRPGLFLAGEVLDIDALTGGFNFQAAWTGAAMVADAIASDLAVADRPDQ